MNPRQNYRQSRHKVTLIGLVIAWLIQAPFSFGLAASSFKIEDLSKPKNIDRSLDQIFYQKIILRHLKTKNDIFFSCERYQQKMNVTSTSFTTQYQAYQDKTVDGKDLAKQVWKTILKRMRDDLKEHLEEQSDQGSPSTALAAPAILYHAKAINHFSPRLKVGSNYIRPGFILENSLNTGMDLTASYHTRDEVLESKILNQISKNLQISVQQVNRFKESEKRNNYLFNLEYQF